MTRARRRFGIALVALLVVGDVLWAPTVRAHNASVHRDMTERAGEIMLALSRDALDVPGDPATVALAAAASNAVRKFQALPAGLPPPRSVPEPAPALAS